MTADSALDSAPVPYFAGFVEGRRGEVLDAALKVFASKGYDCGTMRQIATVLGVTEPALYRHYTGKEALIEDLIATAGDHAVAEVRARMALVRPESVRQSLTELVASGPHRRGGPGGVAQMLLVATPHQGLLLQAFRAHVARPMFESICEFVPRVDAFYGIERSAAETRARSRAVMSLFVGYFMTSMMLGESGQDEAVVDAVLATMGWEDAERSA
jgi:AcrR family transcriptional regulator